MCLKSRCGQLLTPSGEILADHDLATNPNIRAVKRQGSMDLASVMYIHVRRLCTCWSHVRDPVQQLRVGDATSLAMMRNRTLNAGTRAHLEQQYICDLMQTYGSGHNCWCSHFSRDKREQLTLLLVNALR